MSTRWSYKIVDVPNQLFATKLLVRVQEELDRMGAQGWELVSVIQTSVADGVRLYMKKGQ